ncbi:adenine-specific methyltransferase EcoRI family protein [Spirabiliibacterium falconis]|uniref:adenine-specific methyltransferase EcoRI family protein n=1 Tax=Spirabiliibacterium falconis TaxID=572023 RepID=UPI001AAC5193|nr:adenine-specific methyltransferase EcoRI family protein [Spirabiliibacterium falconis]MBE2894686.1 DNA methyltransferase [Spirabiliibacterium falconis]
MTVKNSSLSKAKSAKNDEFYTQYHDIEKEMQAYLDFNPDVFRNQTILLPCDDPEWSHFTKYFAQNFERFGLKKLISTSFAAKSKPVELPYQPTLFESEDAQFDEEKTFSHGKIFTLERDVNHDHKIDIDDLEWRYLEGDGDFRSPEICALRDEADIIITNPPFSLFREFLAWILAVPQTKQFAIIGNMNAITYKEVFPLIKNNEMWLGNGFQSGNAFFSTPVQKNYADGVFDEQTGLVKFRNCVWFTNIEHGRRHQPLQLMTMADNRRFNKQIAKNPNAYQPYDNYDAIEVPLTNAIPSDFEGVMGVPISFLDKYNPEQFEILGIDRYIEDNPNYGKRFTMNNKEVYARILIKHNRSKTALSQGYAS